MYKCKQFELDTTHRFLDIEANVEMTNRETDRETDRQTGKQTDRQTDSNLSKSINILLHQRHRQQWKLLSL